MAVNTQKEIITNVATLVAAVIRKESLVCGLANICTRSAL